MATRAYELWNALPPTLTIEHLLEVQQAFIDEDGDVPAGVQYQLGLTMPEPEPAWEKLAEARAAHFGGQPPERPDDDEPLL